MAKRNILPDFDPITGEDQIWRGPTKCSDERTSSIGNCGSDAIFWESNNAAASADLFWNEQTANIVHSDLITIMMAESYHDVISISRANRISSIYGVKFFDSTIRFFDSQQLAEELETLLHTTPPVDFWTDYSFDIPNFGIIYFSESHVAEQFAMLWRSSFAASLTGDDQRCQSIDK